MDLLQDDVDPVSQISLEENELLSSGQGEDDEDENLYFYNIGDGLSQTPDYDNYNILQLAQRGDVIYDDEGSGGIYGHTAIVEGICYSVEFERYYLRLIESVTAGVCYGLLDDHRVNTRGSSLYKIYTATPSKKDAAVEFCESQLGDGWMYDFSHNYSADKIFWMCSQLVWAGYMNQDIDIECDGDNDNILGVMPRDISVNSGSATFVDVTKGLNTVSD